jgi:hypothetical protein
MRHESPIRDTAVRVMALSLAALMVPQTLPRAAAQQETAPPQAAQQQAAPGPPALPPAVAEPPRQQAAMQDASVASADALPSAPVPQSPTPLQQEQQQTPSQPPALPQQPVGTAAAPGEKPTGVPGSRPSGAAIAPAKQKRVRAIVISLGIVLAAGAAIGATAGLSKASHSTPQ